MLRRGLVRKLQQPIVLIGTMGVGKTGIAKKLGVAFKVRTYDSDAEVESIAGVSVSEIYAFGGQEYFVKKEYEVMCRLLTYNPVIISIGSNTLINSINDNEVYRLIKDKAITVWIRAPLDVIYERVTRRDTRPELNDTDDKKGFLKAQIDKMEPIFKEIAMLTIESSGSDMRYVVDEFMSKFWKQFPNGKREDVDKDNIAINSENSSTIVS